MIPLADFRSARLRDLYLYWDGIRAGRAMPARPDVDPYAIKPLLPHVMMLDVVDGPAQPRFRFRLIGTAITTYAGRDWTGRFVGEGSYGDHADRLTIPHRQVVRTGRPFRNEQYAPWYGKEYQYYERVLLPLSSDGDTVNILLGGLEVINPP
jgi:hypothetical protein